MIPTHKVHPSALINTRRTLQIYQARSFCPSSGSQWTLGFTSALERRRPRQCSPDAASPVAPPCPRRARPCAGRASRRSVGGWRRTTGLGRQAKANSNNPKCFPLDSQLVTRSIPPYHAEVGSVGSGRRSCLKGGVAMMLYRTCPTSRVAVHLSKHLNLGCLSFL